MYPVSLVLHTVTQEEVSIGDVINIASVVNENDMEIVSGAIVVNGEFQGINADEACAVVETVNTPQYCQVNVNDVDEVAGDIVLCSCSPVIVMLCACVSCACVIERCMCIVYN